MLPEEDKHCLIEHMNITERGLLCRLPLVMDDIVWQIPVLPTSMNHAVRQINVLTIHEIVFIQKTDLVNAFRRSIQ